MTNDNQQQQRAAHAGKAKPPAPADEAKVEQGPTGNARDDAEVADVAKPEQNNVTEPAKARESRSTPR